MSPYDELTMADPRSASLKTRPASSMVGQVPGNGDHLVQNFTFQRAGSLDPSCRSQEQVPSLRASHFPTRTKVFKEFCEKSLGQFTVRRLGVCDSGGREPHLECTSPCPCPLAAFSRAQSDSFWPHTSHSKAVPCVKAPERFKDSGAN